MSLTRTALIAAVTVCSGALLTQADAADNPAGTPTDIAVGTASATYRIPDIAVTNRGTILLAYDRRNGSSGDLPNDIDTLLVRSTDGGTTWSRPADIIDYPGPAGCGDSSMVVDRVADRIFLFCTYSAGNVGFGTSQPGTNDTTDPNTLHVLVRHSDDDGQAWSAPTDLNPQVKNVSWQGYFASSGHGIQTSHGRLIQPIVVKDAAGSTRSGDIYSDDHGSSWHAGALLAANTDESKPVELTDGTIAQNSRPDVGGYRFISTSTDGGQTFSAAVPDPQLPDPHVNGDEIRGPRRGWLLFTNAASQLARENLTIRLSCDDGATWPVQKLVHSGPSGYAATALLPGGRIGIFYENGATSYTEKLTFTSLSLHDLGATCGS